MPKYKLMYSREINARNLKEAIDTERRYALQLENVVEIKDVPDEIRIAGFESTAKING